MAQQSLNNRHTTNINTVVQFLSKKYDKLNEKLTVIIDCIAGVEKNVDTLINVAQTDDIAEDVILIKEKLAKLSDQMDGKLTLPLIK